MLYKAYRKERLGTMTDIDVAKYFISKDSKKELFNLDLTHKNNHTFYSGNARLNKFLHLAQNIYIAKHGIPLFDGTLYAYDNGAVSKNVLENYSKLIKTTHEKPVFDEYTTKYLDLIYDIFKEASLDELIEMSHEDNEWQEKVGHYRLEDEKMDSMSRVKEYEKQYADIVEYIDRCLA